MLLFYSSISNFLTCVSFLSTPLAIARIHACKHTTHTMPEYKYDKKINIGRTWIILHGRMCYCEACYIVEWSHYRSIVTFHVTNYKGINTIHPEQAMRVVLKTGWPAEWLLLWSQNLLICIQSMTVLKKH